MSLLEVTNLHTHYPSDDGLIRAVDGVSFSIDRGEVYALVGESGCGKSQTALSIMRLVSCPPCRLAADRIELAGRDVLSLSERQMREVRGSKVSIIFQEPMTSLNPVFTCGSQIVEAIRLHRPMGAAEAKELAVELLGRVGIPDPVQRFREYPHQLSGGMQQRVMIAMALSCNPSLLIADEPTTALDVTIQAQILELLKDLQRNEGLGILLITHDLGVVAETADRVGVMYASKLVEQSDVHQLFAKPLHPYTEGLFRSVPRLGGRKERLDTIPGAVPSPLAFPEGCRFHTRCPLTRELAGKAEAGDTLEIAPGERVLKRCAQEEPPLRDVGQGRRCACWERG